jgi:sialate O-acetylesterase
MKEICMAAMVLKLASVFTNHAVLQQGMTIPIWGMATPLARVECQLGDVHAMTVASEDGRFMLRLPPQKAGGPFILQVKDLSSGQVVKLEDIYIGEVWVASGQSNMELPLDATGDYARKADLPMIRFYQVPMTTYSNGRREANGEWQVCSPTNSGKFSAVAFQFAKFRQPEAGCAVGIIQAAVGGTNIEAWMSRSALLALPEYADEVMKYDSNICDPKLYAEYPQNEKMFDRGFRETEFFRKLFPTMPENAGAREGWQKPEYDDSKWESMTLPDSWTLAGYNHAGIFWYRLNIDLPKSWTGNDLELGIGVADKSDITYFNGEQIGATGDNGLDMCYWDKPRRYIVPGKLVQAGRNVIAVRVSSAVSICTDGGLTGPADAMFIALKDQPKSAISLAFDWRLKMEHDFGIDGADKMRLLGPGEAHSLHILFDNMISPLIPYAVRGAIWYQGEANAICTAGRYRELLTTLIRDWQTQWGELDMKFLVVQLPGYSTPRLYSERSTWALLREAQMQATTETDQPPAICTIDCGDPVNLHPINKGLVGKRLAMAVVGKYSPTFKSMTLEKSSLRLEFNTYDSALKVNVEKLDGFVIAGDDGIFHPAMAKISSANTVIVSCPQVKKPVAVRYAWSDNPSMANLINSEGYPALPFRAKL